MLMEDDATIKLIDFNTAKKVDPPQNFTETIIGSPGYMAHEVKNAM